MAGTLAWKACLSMSAFLPCRISLGETISHECFIIPNTNIFGFGT
jgi:hypothetical protein